MWTDVGGEFNSEQVKELGEAFSFEVSTGAGYAAWMNGVNERNHGVIDRTYEKIMYDDEKMDPEVALAWAVNAKNCLPMNNGFSSFQLVFGKNPNLPNILQDTLPALEGVSTSEAVAEQIRALHAGRKHFAEVQCDEQIRRALRHKVRAVEKSYPQGTKVYYKRDGQSQWRGKATVIGNDGSVYFLRHQGSIYRVPACRICDIEDVVETVQEGEFNTPVQPDVVPSRENAADDMVPSYENADNDKSYTIRKDNSMQTNRNDMPPQNIDEAQFPEGHLISQNNRNNIQHKEIPKVGDTIVYKLNDNPETEWSVGKVFGKGKRGGRNEGYLNIRNQDGSEKGIDILQHEWKLKAVDVSKNNVEQALAVMIPWHQHNLPECQAAKDKEMAGWHENETYIEVDDEGQRRISTMWILAEKTIDFEKGIKARLVARGNQEKANIQADSPTGSKDSLFLVLALGSMHGWRPKTSDVKNAFLQGQRIDRDVFLEPPKDLKKPGKIWKLNKCVYGLDDAARKWFLEVEKDLKELGCIQSKVELCLYFFFDEINLAGLVFLHVDDFLHMGNDHFEMIVVEGIKSKYKIGKCEDGSFVYTGLNIQDVSEGIRIDQNQYIQNIDSMDIPNDPETRKGDSVPQESKTKLRRTVGQANWAARRTRPDVCFDLMELSMRFNNACVSDLKRAKKVVDRLNMDEITVLFPRLTGKVSIQTHSDASFANLVDTVSSGRGHVIFLVDEYQQAAPLSWTANKVKRVVSSTLAAETLSLHECLNTAEYIRFMLAEAMKVDSITIPIHAHVDNDDLYKALHSTSMVSDKKLRIDIASIKQTMSEGDIQGCICLFGSEPENFPTRGKRVSEAHSAAPTERSEGV